MDNKTRQAEQDKIEMDIISCIYMNKKLIPEFGSKIPVDKFSKKNQPLYAAFQGFTKDQLYEVNHNLYVLNPKYLEIVVGACENYSGGYDTDHLMKRFYDVHLSINTTEMLTKAAKDSETGQKGLDITLNAIDKLNSHVDEVIGNMTEIKPLYDELPEVVARLDRRASGKNDLIRASTELSTFNKMTGGIQNQNFIVIAGAYKNGKTTFADNLIVDFAKQGIPTVMINLEMSKAQLQEKMLANLLGIELSHFRDPHEMTSAEMKSLVIKPISKLPLYIESGFFTDSQIRAKMKLYKQRFGIKIVVIDYLNLIKSSEHKAKREEEISALSRFFKQTTTELDLITIMLTQLNREGLEVPKLSKTAEGLGLIRDCDYGFVIYRPCKYDMKYVEIGKEKYIVKDDYMIVKLDVSRHSSDTTTTDMLLRLDSYGRLREPCLFELDKYIGAPKTEKNGYKQDY